MDEGDNNDFRDDDSIISLPHRKSVSKDAVGNLSKLSFGSNTQARAAQSECQNAVGTSGICRNVNRYTFDGSCNNLRNAVLGRTNTCHRRLLPPAYEDGEYSYLSCVSSPSKTAVTNPNG